MGRFLLKMNLNKFESLYEKLLQVILFVMMIALAIVVLVGVTFRFSGHALAWYDEVASVQLAWLTYYGSAYAALKGSHIGVPSILRAFPLSLRKFSLFVKIVIYSFLILLAYYDF